MLRHLTRDAHEWIKEISTFPIYYLYIYILKSVTIANVAIVFEDYR